MALTKEQNDSLWDFSVARKSWADEVEEEFCNEEDKKVTPSRSQVDSCFRLSAVKEEVEKENEDTGIRTRSGINFRLPRVKEENEDSNSMPAPLKTFGKHLTSSTNSKEKDSKEGILVQEDISLTGHLDVKLGLVSPCKSQDGVSGNALGRKTPTKAGKRKLESAPFALSDDALLPSPNKMMRTTPKKEPVDTKPKIHSSKDAVASTPSPSKIMATRKRLREVLTPTTKRSPKREPETDPDVLARRQKQIDFGKNTIGYERYRELVPREARAKNHPKTPPLKFKWSRRAWDGMVKLWRQRLHFWDPPSEGGGNPELLDFEDFGDMGDASDCYSTDGSLPNTPAQKRLKNARTPTPFRAGGSKDSDATESEGRYKNTKKKMLPDDDETVVKDENDSGCTPLPDE